MDLQVGTLMGIPSGNNHIREAFGADKEQKEFDEKDANFLLNTYGQVAVGTVAGATQGGITGALVGGTAALFSKIIDKATENDGRDKCDSDCDSDD